MDFIDVIRRTIKEFCIEFICNPYLCYTEHGQHALFYTMLYNAIPEEERFFYWQDKKVCVLQKEYPTADCLEKPQRQHWDIVVLKTPPESIWEGAKSYDYLKLLASIEFGLNEAEEHFIDDLKRLGHQKANLAHGFIVHLYRLSEEARGTFSGRDWSPSSRRILSLEKVQSYSTGKSVEIFYGITDSSNRYASGLWNIKNGQVFVIQ